MPHNDLYFILKPFSFLRYLNFFLDLFGYVRKRLEKAFKVKFKTFEVTNWNTNSYNKHSARYLKK